MQQLDANVGTESGIAIYRGILNDIQMEWSGPTYERGFLRIEKKDIKYHTSATKITREILDMGYRSFRTPRNP